MGTAPRLPDDPAYTSRAPRPGDAYRRDQQNATLNPGRGEPPSPTDPDLTRPPLRGANPASRWTLVVVLLVVGLVAVNIYVWYGKYTVDLQTNYDAGFSLGYTAGNQTGYDLGYHTGNYSGYTVGYTTGNGTGYHAGHTTGVAEGYASGYDDGYLQGVADGVGSGYVIRDPTYREALNFISSDPTDLNEYTDTYTCHDFTADVKNHAFDLGYRCGYVYILLEEGAHSIVCFTTTDRGLIFIEPQDDRIVQVVIGQPYWDRVHYLPPSYDDTIVSYDIIW